MNQDDLTRIKDYCAKATGDLETSNHVLIKVDGHFLTMRAITGGERLVAVLSDEQKQQLAQLLGDIRTDLPAAIAEIERLNAELEAIRDTADSVVAARAKVELPPDSPLNAAVFCLAKAFRDIGRGLET